MFNKTKKDSDKKGDGLVHSKNHEETNRLSRDSEKGTMQANDHERDGHPKVKPEEKGPDRPGSAS